MRAEVGALAQAASEGRAGGELTPDRLWALFRDEYLAAPGFSVDLDGVPAVGEVTHPWRDGVVAYVRCRIGSEERWGAGVAATPEAARRAAMTSGARRVV